MMKQNTQLITVIAKHKTLSFLFLHLWEAINDNEAIKVINESLVASTPYNSYVCIWCQLTEEE